MVYSVNSYKQNITLYYYKNDPKEKLCLVITTSAGQEFILWTKLIR